MTKRKAIYFFLLILLAVSLILAGIFSVSTKEELAVRFLNIGQGDATLITYGSQQILIDGGPNGQKVLEELGKYVPFWDRTIEVVIATHPDQDHIDGLIDVMETYNVSEVIDNSFDSDSQVYKKYLETIGEKNIPRLKGEKGMSISIRDGAKMEILSPQGDIDNDRKDSNAGSIVSKLTFGENTFLFTGDFPTEKEPELIASGADLISRVLKVAHHGSKYSTSDEFLYRVKPVDAIISVGNNNRDGHPTQEVLNRLSSQGIQILRTDQRGDISYICPNEESACVLE
jgi:competence protein ComEC